jgi:hypothetical protein
VAWIRRSEVGEDEQAERSLPVGESRSMVCRWGLECALRKVVSGLVSSIVWDMVG